MAKATRVSLLDSGSLVIDQSHITWNVGCGTPVRFPVYSVLIEHPDGLFLFDTGFDRDLVMERLPFELPEQTEEQTLPAQLARAGFSVGDVGAVINSHLHFDHCGGNRHLDAAKTILHRDELRQGRAPEPFELLGYADRSWDAAGAGFQLVDGDAELADGLRVFHTPGHTIGHLSLLVELEGTRPLLFVADVVYTADAYARDHQAGFHWNPCEGVRSIRRVKELARAWDAQVFFSHDMEAFKSYKLAPDAYAPMPAPAA
ncbi:MAG TPA: N-acyl homoserine lactonase family protein [Conexibacter sp.]|jgi:4-pyridoxolactonase